MIPDNELSYNPMYQASMDSMYHHYQRDYQEVYCKKCKNTWWQRKEELPRELCYECNTKLLKEIASGVSGNEYRI